MVFVGGRRQGRESALALDAAGIRYALHVRRGECTILVAEADAERARAEIEAYAAENVADHEPPSVDIPHHGNGWIGIGGYAAILILVEVLQRRYAYGFDWFHAGQTNAGLIRTGEWWRAFTALTLHVDIGHLVSNLGVGGLVGLFAGQLLGSGRGWLLIFLAGGVGNILTALLRHPEHRSVGASTSVFAALGLVAAYGWMRRQHSRASMFKRVAPLIGAVVLLSLLGTGGERTDVMAHVMGFGAGVIFGSIYAMVARSVTSLQSQLIAGAMAVGLLIIVWSIALTA